MNKIKVTSHVSRDFLQNAAVFNTLEKVVWEYVSNSIDSTDEDKVSYVDVEIRQDVLTISDNGSGMDKKDLNRFFQMHAENINRKSGKKVRGKFGTGKSAAFGIGSELEIESFKNGVRNMVLLTLEDIKSAKNGEAFNVKILIDNENTDSENGSVVRIRRFHDVKLNIEKTVRYIEKQLYRLKVKPKITINDHLCKYKEPPFTNEWTLTPPSEVRERIGDVKMNIKAAPTPLLKEDVGIDVLSGGIWHETTLADVTGDQVYRIFGHVDVPLLDDDSQNIPAFDNTRNGLLNRSNPVVTALLFWIQEEVKKIQKELVEEVKAKKKTEEAKKLKKHADQIASILNNDFNDVLDELDHIKSIAGRKRKKVSQHEGTDFILPGEGVHDSNYIETGRDFGEGKKGKSLPDTGDTEREGPGLKPGQSKGSPGSISNNPGRRRSSGMFTIEFINETKEEKRSRYDNESKIIYINMDHPQVEYSLKSNEGSVNNIQFKQLVFEIAIVEYAQALQFEMYYANEIIDITEALYSIGEIIDRVSRKLAEVG